MLLPQSAGGQKYLNDGQIPSDAFAQRKHTPLNWVVFITPFWSLLNILALDDAKFNAAQRTSTHKIYKKK
ncbi:MAG: hypothetical protein AAF738_02845 [Bacteroidota bacterium]